MVKRKSGHPIDAMTAALLAGVAGAKVPASSLGTNRLSLQVHQQQLEQQEDDQRQTIRYPPTRPESTASGIERRRPNLSIDVAREDSDVMRCVEHAPPMPSMGTVQPTSAVKTEDPAHGKGHLRRRSWKSVSGAVLPIEAGGEDSALAQLPMNDQHVTRRKVTPKLTPPEESIGDEELEEGSCAPPAPRSSLEEQDYELSRVEEEKVEVSCVPFLLRPLLLTWPRRYCLIRLHPSCCHRLRLLWCRIRLTLIV